MILSIEANTTNNKINLLIAINEEKQIKTVFNLT